MLRPLAVLLVTLAAAAPAFAADPPSTAAAPSAMQAMSADAFLAKAAVANKFEIDSSKLALTKSKSENVKTFANKMITDHGQAAIKMKLAVTDAKIKAPADSLDATHQTLLDDLKKKDGAAFDQAYADAQLKGHEETVAMFETYEKNSDSPRIKQFASDLLPTLRGHLDHAKKLQASAGKSI
jgi:putative membrane protein